MITLRQFQINDFEELVDMYYEFTKEVYHNRKIGDRYFFYRSVQDWINSKRDIVIAEDNGKILGFSKCWIDDMGGLTEAMYQCDFAYVKPLHRKSRVAYMLYHNANEYATKIGLKISSQGRVENGVSEMMSKHFGLEAKFIVMESM